MRVMVSKKDRSTAAPRKVISLFTGAGGLDIGFERAGFDVRVSVESDPACCMTLRRNRPEVNVINKKIEEVSSEEMMELAGLRPLDAALVIGGPPCQPFSLAGARKGLEDPKGMLLMEFIRVVREALPHGFVMENVRGLLNWDNGRAKEMLMEEFQKPIVYKGRTYRYDVSVKLLNASEFGVPQKRERVFFVGNRLGVDFEFPRPTHADPEIAKRVGLKKIRTSWDAIGSLPPPEEPSETAKMVAQTIRGRIQRHGY